VLCPNDICLPEVLIKIFTVPAAVFCCKVIDIIKFITVQDSFQLSVLAYIAPDIIFPLSVVNITGNNFMSPTI
jgi:hypothetical protein